MFSYSSFAIKMPIKIRTTKPTTCQTIGTGIKDQSALYAIEGKILGNKAG